MVGRGVSSQFLFEFILHSIPENIDQLDFNLDSYIRHPNRIFDIVQDRYVCEQRLLMKDYIMIIERLFNQQMGLIRIIILMTLGIPLIVTGTETISRVASTEISQEAYKEKNTNAIRQFIQEKNLSRIVVRIGLNDIDNEFDRENIQRRDLQVATKYQRVLDTLVGFDYSIEEGVDELGYAVLSVTINGFDMLASNPDVEDISSPTIDRQIAPSILQKRTVGTPVSTTNRIEILEKWRQQVISKIDAGSKFITVTITLNFPEETRPSGELNITKIEVIEDFLQSLSGTNFKTRGGTLSDPPKVTIDIDESAVYRILSNQEVIGAIVQ